MFRCGGRKNRSGKRSGHLKTPEGRADAGRVGTCLEHSHPTGQRALSRTSKGETANDEFRGGEGPGGPL